MVNIIGDLILVAGFHLDAAGAAIATVAAQAVSVILALIILKKKRSTASASGNRTSKSVASVRDL